MGKSLGGEKRMYTAFFWGSHSVARSFKHAGKGLPCFFLLTVHRLERICVMRS